jgi:ABC-type amino acid transport substrate-binding protein
MKRFIYNLLLKERTIKLIYLLKRLAVCTMIFSTVSESAPIKTNLSMLTMDQIPYGYKDNDGNNTGVLFDVMNAVMKASGIGKKHTLIPSKRLGLKMFSGSPVCVIVANTPEVTTQSLIAPIGYSLKMGILPKTGSGITDYKSLKGKTVAVPLGVQFDTVFHNDKNIIKVSPPQYINAIKMLKADRVDAVAGALGNLKSIAIAVGMEDKDLASPIILTQNEMYLICTKEVLMTTRQKLKETVMHLKATGEINNILHRYIKN